MSEKRENRILVVDDDPGAIRLLETILRDKGYQVLTATEASLGLEIVIK